MKIINASILSILALGTFLPFTDAQAASLYAGNLNSLGEQASPGDIDTSFFSAAGTSATMTFQLAGYASLDGAGNCCSDLFHLSINGTEVLTGSFNMGGGGTNILTLSPVGATALTTTYGATDDPHNSQQITWSGGITDISLPIAVAAGTNLLSFSYTGAAQGLGDEGWGVNAVNVTPVPEPETYALIMAGLGLMGFVARRRRTV